MRVHATGGGFLARCECGWDAWATTRAAVERVAGEHECGRAK